MKKTYNYTVKTCLATICVFSVGVLAEPVLGQSWSFVSIPDFQNYDLASIAGLPSYDGGPDSSTANYESSIDFILSSIAEEKPAFVTVAGDLVMGHWDRDVDNRHIFGPTNTLANKRLAIDAAADHYYGAWRARFAAHDLPVHALLGDHEIGDNNWDAGSDLSHLVSTYKDAFARHFTQDSSGKSIYSRRPTGTAFEDTSYAFQHENMLVVMLDVFKQDNPNTKIGPNGSVLATVDGDHLEWLNNTLAAARADATIDHIVVQGHAPILTPVRTRHSSGISLRDSDGSTGPDTALWQVLEAHQVDTYFAGEVHDVSSSDHGGVLQIAHGALIGRHSPINYMVTTVSDTAIRYDLKALDVQLGSGKLWQTGSNRPLGDLIIDDATRAKGFVTAGTLVIDKSTGFTIFRDRTGVLQPFGLSGSAGGVPVNGVLLDNTDTGFTATGWNSSFTPAQAFDGGHAIIDDGGVSEAKWTFNQLEDGTYGVYVTWRSDPVNSSSAAVFEIGEGLEQIVVDQTISPSGDLFVSDDNSRGHQFQLLGEATVVGGKLVVSLRDDAEAGNNTFVLADAVLIVQRPVPEPGSLALLGLGGLLIARRRRRRRA